MKRAVITGATGGIGGKTAEVLGLTGYEVIVTGIDEAGRQAVMSNLESKGIKAHFYFCDATNEEQVNETFAKIAQEFDSLDLLVNNVGGLGGRQRVSEMETSFMRKVMALNFDSLFFNTRAALPLLKRAPILPSSTSAPLQSRTAVVSELLSMRHLRARCRATPAHWRKIWRNSVSVSTWFRLAPSIPRSTRLPIVSWWRAGRTAS